jgi:protein-disulfide isomerase-like protein with CxxC motif
MMKTVNYLFAILTIMCISSVSFAQSSDDESKISETEKIAIYYFHNTRRCATCNAVEDVTKATLKEFYEEQVKSGEITFESLNLEEEAGEAMAKKLKVSGQTLLIIKNGKKKDLTNDAFMYAKSKPEKFKAKIHKVIGTI